MREDVAPAPTLAPGHIGSSIDQRTFRTPSLGYSSLRGGARGAARGGGGRLGSDLPLPLCKTISTNATRNAKAEQSYWPLANDLVQAAVHRRRCLLCCGDNDAQGLYEGPIDRAELCRGRSLKYSECGRCIRKGNERLQKLEVAARTAAAGVNPNPNPSATQPHSYSTTASEFHVYKLSQDARDLWLHLPIIVYGLATNER